MSRPASNQATRITASFDAETANQIRQWGVANGAASQSEALRLLVAYALGLPYDPALTMAYQQARADLTQFARAGLVEVFQRLEDEYHRRGGR